jgi:hypothetical protein
MPKQDNRETYIVPMSLCSIDGTFMAWLAVMICCRLQWLRYHKGTELKMKKTLVFMKLPTLQYLVSVNLLLILTSEVKNTYIAHTFSYTIHLDNIALETKSIVVR